MIVKDTTVAVNFYVIDTDGFPATGMSSSITALMYINGSSSTSISDSIYEIGDGWYYFNHNFDTEGNAFISFSASSCVISPWEEYVIAGTGASAADIWNHSFSGSTASEYLYSASVNAYSAYTAVGSIPTPPSTGAIATSVWNYNLGTLVTPDMITGDLLSAIPSRSDIGSLVWGSTFMETADALELEPNDLLVGNIWTFGGSGDQTHAYSTAFEILDGMPTINSIASGVWGYNISNTGTAVAASTYLRSTYGLPSRVWSHSWGTPTSVSAYSYLTSIYNNTSSITIPTPPSAGAIATSVWAHTSRSVTTTLVDDGAAAGNETYIATGSNVSDIPSAVADSVWGKPISHITASVWLASISAVPKAVWTYGDTDVSISRLVNNSIPTVSDIWGYTIGNPVQTASTYLGSIGTLPYDVWNYSTTGKPSTDRSLTYYPSFPTDYAKPSDIPTDDISAIKTKVNSLQNTDLTGIATTSDITTLWDSTNTSISNLQDYGNSHWSTATGFASSDDIPAISSIVNGVWTQTNRSLTTALVNDGAPVGSVTYLATYADIANVASNVWSYHIGTGRIDAKNYLISIGSIPSSVWAYKSGETETSSDRSLTYYPTFPTVSSIQDGLASTADITTLWSSTSTSISNLQDHGDQTWVYTGGTGITAADVWNYPIGNTSAISFVQGISTNTNSISINTGSIATSYATIAGNIGTNTTDITSIKTSIGSITTSIGSINTSLGTIGGNMTSIASSVDYNKAALLNWSLSTASVLALHVGDTTTTYSIARDLAGNITGVSPNN